MLEAAGGTWFGGGMETFTLDGHAGSLHARRWTPAGEASYVVLLCHGYGEHVGRYEHVAARLNADGSIGLRYIDWMSNLRFAASLARGQAGEPLRVTPVSA